MHFPTAITTETRSAALPTSAHPGPRLPRRLRSLAVGVALFGMALPSVMAPMTAATVQARDLTGDQVLDASGKPAPTPSPIFGPAPVVLPALTPPQNAPGAAPTQPQQTAASIGPITPLVAPPAASVQAAAPQAAGPAAPAIQSAPASQPSPTTQPAPVTQPANPFPTHQAFLNAVGAAARAAQAQTGVPASVTIAQAILESNWGDSLLSRQANNYFGLKAVGNQPSVTMPTTEVDGNGVASTVQAAFRAYPSMIDSLVDHDNLFTRLSRYAPAMAARSDPQQFAKLIAAGGYATDPAYPQKLINLMNTYNLYQYDLPATSS